MTDLSKHAEAILRALSPHPINHPFWTEEERKNYLAACAALFDAAARAMQEKAATGWDEPEWDGHELLWKASQIERNIRSIDPASLRSE